MKNRLGRVVKRFWYELVGEKMEMDMHNFLPALGAYIELELISGNFHTFAQVTSYKKKPPDEGAIRIRHMGYTFYVRLWDDEHVDAGFRMQVVYDYAIVIFVDLLCFYLSWNDVAKYTHALESAE